MGGTPSSTCQAPIIAQSAAGVRGMHRRCANQSAFPSAQNNRRCRAAALGRFCFSRYLTSLDILFVFHVLVIAMDIDVFSVLSAQLRFCTLDNNVLALPCLCRLAVT